MFQQSSQPNFQSLEDHSFPENNIIGEAPNIIKKDPKYCKEPSKRRKSVNEYFIDRLDSIDQKDFNIFGDNLGQSTYKFPSLANAGGQACQNQFSSFVNSNISTQEGSWVPSQKKPFVSNPLRDMKIKIFVNSFGNSDMNEIVELPKKQAQTNSLESLGLNISEQ